MALKVEAEGGEARLRLLGGISISVAEDKSSPQKALAQALINQTRSRSDRPAGLGMAGHVSTMPFWDWCSGYRALCVTTRTARDSLFRNIGLENAVWKGSPL